MTQPAFDPAMFGGQPSTPPVPMVVCWDDLPPDVYARTLAELADWIGWLRATYRIPATVIPPCWFTHPGLREDIGHLWTGWLLTRHPDAGVGMVGLDWDQRRESAIGRLREATAITGCTATRHQAEPEPVAAIPPATEQLWQDHLNDQTLQRVRATARQAAADHVIDVLQAAELRHDLAPTILADTADDPAAAGTDDRAQVAERLRQFAVDAVDRAAQSALDAARTVLDAQQHTAHEGAVALTRGDVADLFAAAALADQNPSTSDDLAQKWLDALERLLRLRSPQIEPLRPQPHAPPPLISVPPLDVVTRTLTTYSSSWRKLNLIIVLGSDFRTALNPPVLGQGREDFLYSFKHRGSRIFGPRCGRARDVLKPSVMDAPAPWLELQPSDRHDHSEYGACSTASIRDQPKEGQPAPGTM